jgi:ketosteroid isomerase-like protein
MNRILVVLAVTLLAAGPAGATEKADVMASIHQFVDGFNKGDVKSALATCAEQTSIIDEFPPHEWHGAGACSTWANDFDADAKKNGITDTVVTLGTPRHVDITGDRAYVVVPTNYTYKQKGKPMKEIGSTMTLSLQKVAAGWRITGWAWAKK